jgi:hypothetical protein
LTIIRGGSTETPAAIELIVSEIVAGSGDELRTAVSAWAARFGYRRVWFPDEVIALKPNPSGDRGWRATCPVCRATWSDDTHEFLAFAHEVGFFPLDCPLCGSALPQQPALEARDEHKAAGTGAPIIEDSTTSHRYSVQKHLDYEEVLKAMLDGRITPEDASVVLWSIADYHDARGGFTGCDPDLEELRGLAISLHLHEEPDCDSELNLTEWREQMLECARAVIEGRRRERT